MIIARKLFLCWWGGCGMVQRGDDKYLWGECPGCGKVSGLVSREAIRRYIDAKERRREFERRYAELIAARDKRSAHE